MAKKLSACERAARRIEKMAEAWHETANLWKMRHDARSAIVFYVGYAVAMMTVEIIREEAKRDKR